MQIQSYQIHNVLDFYRKQLSQGKLERPIQTGGGDTAKDSVYISPEGKSQAIMEKVTDSVLKKITNVKPESVPGDGTLQSPLPNGGGANSARYDNRFVFKTIAGNNQLETRSIAVDDSQMLVRRLHRCWCVDWMNRQKGHSAAERSNQQHRPADTWYAERTIYRRRQSRL